MKGPANDLIMGRDVHLEGEYDLLTLRQRRLGSDAYTTCVEGMDMNSSRQLKQRTAAFPFF